MTGADRLHLKCDACGQKLGFSDFYLDVHPEHVARVHHRCRARYMEVLAGRYDPQEPRSQQDPETEPIPWQPV